jgi:predicted metal-dependent hydrolase
LGVGAGFALGAKLVSPEADVWLLYGDGAAGFSLLEFDTFARHGIGVTRVAVRNQRTRWGSCSPRGVVSLNWRLVQVPEAVRDYVILHELAHRRHMNHSERFWDEVRRLCPDFEVSERWLRENSRIVL